MSIQKGFVWLGCIFLAIYLATGINPGSAAEFTYEPVVPSSKFLGIHGMAFDSSDRLYVGSILGQSIYTVDTSTGNVEVHVGPPNGMADDMEFAPDGTLVWTSFLLGKVHALGSDGQVRLLAEGLPGINSIAFAPDGRLFATQVFLGDALYEIDLKGLKPARKIIEGMGGLNGFDFGPDGYLYGPLWFKGQVVKVNVDSGELSVIAEGFKIPAAANFDSKGNLYVVDTMAGEVVNVDTKTGEKILIANVRSSIDNLAIDSRDRLYISNMADNGIYEIDVKTGTARTVIEGKFSAPADLTVVTEDGKDTIYIVDVFAFRKVDAATGKVSEISRVFAPNDAVEYPMNISVRGDHLIVTSWFSGTVQLYDRSTNKLLSTWREFVTPHDALELDDGSVIVTELATGKLLRVTGENGEERVTVLEGLAGPNGLARAGDGSIYLTELGGNLSRIDLAAGTLEVVYEGLVMPQGIAVAPDGKIVVVEVGAKRIVSIEPKSGTLTVLAENVPVGIPAPEGMPPTNIPNGVAVSEMRTVYFSSDIDNAIYRLVEK